MIILDFGKLLKTTLKIGNDIMDRIILNLIIKKISEDIFREICVLVDLSLIGDVLVSLPYYHRLFLGSKGKIGLSIISNYTTAYIFNKMGFDVIPIDFKQFMYNPLYRMRLIRKIGKVKYVAISHPNRTEEMEEVCLKLLSKYKIVYEGEAIYERFKKKKNLKNFSYIIPNPYCHGIVHISRHLKVVFSSISSILNLGDLSFQIGKEDFFALYRKFFSNSKTWLSNNYIVILPDASVPYRRYSQAKWQKVINSIPKNMRIIQLGLRIFPLEHPNLIDLTGKTSLKEAIPIVMNASLVIGNETGLTHLAYLSGVPTVCILGGGHFGRFLPWPEFDDIVKCVYKPMDCFQCGWRCKYVNLRKGEVPPCISQISPDNVLEAIEELDKEYKIFS